MDKKKVSMAVVRRLPKYKRYLKELMQNDVNRISSKAFSEKIGFSASQIRQDLNCFGDFGQQGYGYNVKELYDKICGILGLNREYNTIIIGAGNIGQAVANYINFDKLGFKLVGIFDINPKLIGLKIRDIEIMDVDNIDKFLKEVEVNIAIVCVPKNSGQKITDVLVNSGIEGIWNFAPVDLVVPENIVVENVHLSESLLTLSYLMTNSKKMY